MSEVYVMVTICSRKNMPRFVDCYKDYNVEAANISLGRGTASSDVLDLLGLEDDEKGIHMSLVTEDTWKNVKKGLQSKLRIDVPGTGIAFIVSLSSIGGKRELGFLIDGQEYKKGDESTLKDTKHELIVAIANYGYNTLVMRAAEEGGATGGTVLHGTKSSQKNAIMRAIMDKAGVDSKAGTIVFSLPVTSTAGLRIHEDSQDEEVDDENNN